MELRNYKTQNHLHFIWSIKGGSVTRVSNVNPRGRPVLKLRKLQYIYEKEIFKQDELLPRVQPRVLRDSGNIPDMSTSPCLLSAELKIKDEPKEEYDVGQKGIAAVRDVISDDRDFCDTTLEQIRKQCKVNKRKCQNPSNMVTLNNDLQVKEEHLIFHPKDGECDLEETLSSWKSKFSKRRKGRKKLKAKNGSTSSTMLKEDSLVSRDVKLEDFEHSYCVYEAMNSIAADSLPRYEEESSSSENLPPEAPTRTKPAKEEMSISAGQAQIDVNEESIEFQDSTSVFDEVSFEYQDNIRPIILSISSVCKGETTKADGSEVTSLQNSDSAVRESGYDDCANGPISSNSSSESKAAYEDGESVDPEPEFCRNVTGWEIVKMEGPEILAIEYPGFPVLDFKGENSMIRALAYDFSFNEGCLSRNYHLDTNLLMCSSVDHASLPASPISQVQELDIDHIDHGLQFLDLNITENSLCETEGVAKNYPNNIPKETAIEQLALCYYSHHGSYSDPADCVISGDEDHLPTKRQSESSEHTDSAGDINSAQSINASAEITIASETYSAQRKKLHRPPEKLCSRRKLISPTSQEKLRKALERRDSPEKNSNQCKGKLYFSSQNAHRILKAEGLDNIERSEVALNTKQMIQRPNNFKQTQHQKATSRIPRSNNDAATPLFSTGCTSLQVCSQNAIAFSQRQMHDIRSLASKLRNQLSSMKQIMEGYLQIEGSPSRFRNCNMDEAKIAIGNAGKAEETAKKWLSMMERDCNRFSKLMGIIQQGSSAPENVAKKKRKITFADDAGRDLCHVKVFENDIASPQSAVEEESVDQR